MVPDPDVSVTVAVQVEACPARTAPVHDMVADDPRLDAASVVDPELTEWVPSPA